MKDQYRSTMRRTASSGLFRRSLASSLAAWREFDIDNGAIMWLGHTVELKQHLLNKEWDTFTCAGIEDGRVLKKCLSTNSRESLNVRSRAFAAKAQFSVATHWRCRKRSAYVPILLFVVTNVHRADASHPRLVVGSIRRNVSGLNNSGCIARKCSCRQRRLPHSSAFV